MDERGDEMRQPTKAGEQALTVAKTVFSDESERGIKGPLNPATKQVMQH